MRKYKKIRAHPNYSKLGAFWSWFYIIRPFVLGYLTWRVAILFVKTAKNQWAGNHNFYETIMCDEVYYLDHHRDTRDHKMVNFRYSDHVEQIQRISHINHDIFKPEADYAKGLINYFRKTSTI